MSNGPSEWLQKSLETKAQKVSLQLFNKHNFNFAIINATYLMKTEAPQEH